MPYSPTLWAVGLVMLLLPVGCEAGAIELRTGAPDEVVGAGGDTGGDVSSGGDVGSGGDTVQPPPPGTGGTSENIGGGGPAPDDPYPDSPYPLPCLVTGSCFAFCDEDRPGCTPCDRDRDCPVVVPRCDGSLDRCVECLDDHDCEETFGPHFAECSLGMCVQCQRDEHCAPGYHCEHGWCGHCEEDYECPFGMECFRDHCVPEP